MLTAIEDLLLARAESALGATVRAYLPLPGGMAQLAAILRRRSLTPPVVFCAWRGSERPAWKTRDGGLEGAAGLHMHTIWSALAVTQDAAGEAVRRRGDAARGVIGGTQIAERLAVALHDHTLTGHGTLAVRNLGPIDSEALTDLDVTITEVQVTLAHDLGAGLDPAVPAALDDFLTFHQDQDGAADTVSLPGPALTGP